jgi:CBS domain-containing protein
VIIANVAALIQGRSLAQVKPDSTVREACEVMCSHDTGAVVVVDEGRRLVGVLSERDVIRKVVCQGRHSAETPAADIMTPDPRTIAADGDLAHVLEIMSTGGFHHVPVMEGETVVGMVSADDIPEEYRMLLERFREMRSA